MGVEFQSTENSMLGFCHILTTFVKRRMKLKTPLQLYLQLQWCLQLHSPGSSSVWRHPRSRLPDESSGDETYVTIELCRGCVIFYVPCATWCTSLLCRIRPTMHRLGARRELMVVVVRRRALCPKFAGYRACVGRRVFTAILPSVSLPPYLSTIR